MQGPGLAAPQGQGTAAPGMDSGEWTYVPTSSSGQLGSWVTEKLYTVNGSPLPSQTSAMGKGAGGELEACTQRKGLPCSFCPLTSLQAFWL